MNFFKKDDLKHLKTCLKYLKDDKNLHYTCYMSIMIYLLSKIPCFEIDTRGLVQPYILLAMHTVFIFLFGIYIFLLKLNKKAYFLLKFMDLLVINAYGYLFFVILYFINSFWYKPTNIALLIGSGFVIIIYTIFSTLFFGLVKECLKNGINKK